MTGDNVTLAFETATLRIELEQILPLREVTDHVRQSVKYAQIAASIREVGIIEPPVVSRDGDDPEVFHLLDGHVRFDILKNSGIQAVVCLVATDDEAFTYNKRINRLAIIQEHRMIRTALEKGVSEEKLARALNVNIASIRSRKKLLDGICAEAVDLLKDRHVPIGAFRELRRLKPLRQVEAAELMVAMNRFSMSYVCSLVAATPSDQLVRDKSKAMRGLTVEQIERMEVESARLHKEFRMIERDYGADHLDLVLATGWVGRLLENARIVGHLARAHPGILSEFQKLVELRVTK